MFADQFGAQQVAVPRQGAEADNAASATCDPSALGFDVDQQLRRRQTHVQAGQQALAAGNRHGLVATLGQNAIGLLQRTKV